MDSKLNSIVITSILAFTLIAGIIPIAFVNVIAQGEGGDTGGMTEGQSEDNGGDEENKDNGN